MIKPNGGFLKTKLRKKHRFNTVTLVTPRCHHATVRKT